MNLILPAKLSRKRRRSFVPQAWRTPLALIGTVIALAWIVVVLFAPLIAPHDPLAQDLPRLTAPDATALMGTDANGRDVFSRLIIGARTTIPLALMLVVCAMVIGTIIGALAGYLGGWVDEVLMRLTDMVMAFPTIILAMVIAASLGPSIMNAVIAGIIVAWPPYARITRSLVLGLRTQNYVVAGRLLGASPLRSLTRDILPNIAGPVLVLASLDIGTAILLLSGLSFLGLGAQPPTPEWGTMIAAALQNTSSWWLGVFPGLAILTVVMAFNFIGDSLRDALDPLAAREREATQDAEDGIAAQEDAVPAQDAEVTQPGGTAARPEATA